MAIAGEVYEYTEMYSEFSPLGPRQEGNHAAVREMTNRSGNRKSNAARFSQMLAKAAENAFAALAKVEERHANHYKATLANVRS